MSKAIPPEARPQAARATALDAAGADCSDPRLKDPLEVLRAQNEEPVETFRTDRAHKSLGNPVGLWRAKRCLNDLNPVASEDDGSPGLRRAVARARAGLC
jgi:hypothetical protein